MSKKADFEERVKELKGKYGDAVKLASELPPMTFHTTGVEALDMLLGGGFPCGRLIHMYGPPRCGKTTFMLTMAETYSQVLYLDADRKLTQNQVLGMKENFVCMQPETLEEALQVAITVAAYPNTLIVLDSLPAFTPTKELDLKNVKDFTKVSNVAGTAGLLSRKLPVLITALAKSGAICVVLNQVRDKMNLMNPYENPVKTMGGHQLDHLSSLRISMWDKGKLKHDKLGTYGHLIVFGIEKSNVGPSWVRTEVGYIQDVGIVPVASMGEHTKRLLQAAGARQITIDKPFTIEITEQTGGSNAGYESEREDGEAGEVE